MAIDFPADLKEKIENERISYGAAASIRFLGREDRTAVCEFLEDLRPSASVMKEFSEHILDISKRDGVSAAGIINAPDIKGITAADCSRKIKTEKIRKLLREKRYPSLSAKENELKTVVKQLSLPANISLIYPANFEGKKVSLTIRFENTGELTECLDEINKKRDLLREFLKIL
ncbi:MAG: hypothetical protein U9O97_00205 [Elusimicrobiota bacterium]|nr:hypothetical protein [Elusimicrobiota bacterium]